MKMENLSISLLMMLSVGAMSFLSPESTYRFFPLVIGAVSVIGYNLRSLLILDTGIFFTLLSYTLAVSRIAPSLENILMITVFFFLILGMWFYARNTILISDIVKREDPFNGLSDYKRSSINQILNTLFPAMLLSLIGFVIVFYSSLDMALDQLTESLIVVALSSAVFLVTLSIIKILSSHGEKSKDGS